MNNIYHLAGLFALMFSLVLEVPFGKSSEKSLLIQSPLDSLIFSKVKIISFEKIIDEKSDYYTSYKKDFNKWGLSKNKIADILLRSRKIDGIEWDYSFDILPCSYIGTAIINDKIKVQFEINAGSSTTILYNDSSIHLGYYGHKHYFMDKPEKPE